MIDWIPSLPPLPICIRRMPSGASVVKRLTALTTVIPSFSRQRPFSPRSAAWLSGGSTGSGPLPRLIDRPGRRSESSASTRRPCRASRRAVVPAITDLPAPPLPTTAILMGAEPYSVIGPGAGAPGGLLCRCRDEPLGQVPDRHHAGRARACVDCGLAVAVGSRDHGVLGHDDVRLATERAGDGLHVFRPAHAVGHE